MSNYRFRRIKNKTVGCKCIDKWGKHSLICNDKFDKWFKETDRVLFSDNINGYLVLTVFNGISDGYDYDGKHLLFSTSIFGPKMFREFSITTKPKAKKNHRICVEFVSKIKDKS